LKKYVPPISRSIRSSKRDIVKIRETFPKHEKQMHELKKEIDQLTTVWLQENEKTTHMNKLLTALFSEVTDVQDH